MSDDVKKLEDTETTLVPRNPFDQLDDTQQMILQVELANTHKLASWQIGQVLDLHQSTVRLKRSAVPYRYALSYARRNALEHLMDAQVKAIRTLKSQLGSADEKIAQGAAKFLATATLDQVRAKLLQEVQKDAVKTPQKHIVEVKFSGNDNKVLGDPIEVESKVLPDPDQKPTESTPVAIPDAEKPTDNPPEPPPDEEKPALPDQPDPPQGVSNQEPQDDDDDVFGAID